MKTLNLALTLSLSLALGACNSVSSNSNSKANADVVGNGVMLRTSVTVQITEVIPTRGLGAQFVDVGVDGTAHDNVDSAGCTQTTELDATSTVCDGATYTLTYGRTATGPLKAQLLDKNHNRHYGFTCQPPATPAPGVDEVELYVCAQTVAHAPEL